MTTPEGKVRDYLLKKCKDYGLVPYKLNFENRRGAPDWLITGMGKHLFIELKAPNGKLSPAQEATIDSMVLTGGCVVRVCSSSAEIDKVFSGFFV